MAGQKNHYDVEFTPTRLEKISSTPSYLYGEAVSFTAELLGVDKSKAREYNSVVNDYSDRAYTQIRALQRGEQVDDWAREGAERKARALEEYIDKAPKWAGGATYRGINADSMPKIGDVIDMGGTSSWSSSLEEAKDYADGYGGTNRIVFRSQTQTKGTSIRHLAKFAHENEVTVSKNAKFRVSSTKVEDGITYIAVKELR